MKKVFFLAFGLLTLALSSCYLGGSNECKSQYVGVATTAVTGPETAAVNETVTLQVTFSVSNSCGEFQLFHNEQGEPNETIVTVNAQYDGCSCDNTAVSMTQPYTFKAIAPGTYIIRFRKSNTEFITKQIVVQ
jgi:hypothetical protein